MRRARIFFPFVLSLVLLAPLGAVPAQAPQPYRILISNDDGVHAAGIAALAQPPQAIGDVTIVAPAENYSGAGHSIVTSQPVFREDLTLPNEQRDIGLPASPA